MEKRTCRLTPDQRKAIDSLFIQNFGQLLDIAGDSRDITPIQPMEIVQYVSHCLQLFPVDNASPQDFLEWASTIILPVRQLLALKNLYSKQVFDGIWRMMRGYTDLLDSPDLSVPPIERPLTGIDEIACTVWEWAWEHIEELSDPEITKSPLSRLNAVAYWAARTWVTRKLRERGYKPNGDRQTISLTELSEVVLQDEAKHGDGASLSKAADSVLALPNTKRSTKRSKEEDFDTSNWGRPVTGSWLLCRDCKVLNRVKTTNGWTAVLSCSHTRTSDSGLKQIAA